MKRIAVFSSILFVCLTATALAQTSKKCRIDVVGTWKAESAGAAVLYRFTADGALTVLEGAGPQAREIITAAYALDHPRSPKVIQIKAERAGGGLPEGTTALEIAGYDETSLTVVHPGGSKARWTKVDPNRYFLVLAGRSGVFYDRSGPVFPMFIKMDGRNTQVDALGIYAVGDRYVFGPVPAATTNEFMKEPRDTSRVMLRLEITGAQYERGIQILQTWERRIRENTLPYSDVFLDNVMLVGQVTEDLNQCGEKVRLYKLDWSLADHISEDNPPSLATFLFFKEMRRLNESLHVSDEKFFGHGRMAHKEGDR